MCPAKENPWLPKEGQYILVRLESKRESALRVCKYNMAVDSYWLNVNSSID